MHRILVPLDGSPLAETVMPTALEIGEALGAEWVLVRVSPPYPTGWAMAASAWGPVEPWDEIVETGKAAEQEAHEYLSRVREKMAVDRSRVTIDARQGALPSALLNAVTDHEATLIAMSTHGRGGLNRLVMGSVTDMVIRLSSVPVIVVHPPSVG
ncbi:MAG: universal stress protein [Clostridia bacterium]